LQTGEGSSNDFCQDLTLTVTACGDCDVQTELDQSCSQEAEARKEDVARKYNRGSSEECLQITFTVTVCGEDCDIESDINEQCVDASQPSKEGGGGLE